jgi:hypothetical protein
MRGDDPPRSVVGGHLYVDGRRSADARSGRMRATSRQRVRAVNNEDEVFVPPRLRRSHGPAWRRVAVPRHRVRQIKVQVSVMAIRFGALRLVAGQAYLSTPSRDHSNDRWFARRLACSTRRRWPRQSRRAAFPARWRAENDARISAALPAAGARLKREPLPGQCRDDIVGGTTPVVGRPTATAASISAARARHLSRMPAVAGRTVCRRRILDSTGRACQADMHFETGCRLRRSLAEHSSARREGHRHASHGIHERRTRRRAFADPLAAI